MLSVILIVSIIGFLICLYMYNKSKDHYEFWDGLLCVFIILGIVSFVLIILTFVSLINGRDITSRIAMYEERNAIIEQQVELTVKTFTDHETEVFNNASPESFITLVSLYPELKSDELMSKQIDVYLDNNQRICVLKEDELKLQRARFWLYFGK